MVCPLSYLACPAPAADRYTRCPPVRLEQAGFPMDPGPFSTRARAVKTYAGTYRPSPNQVGGRANASGVRSGSSPLFARGALFRLLPLHAAAAPLDEPLLEQQEDDQHRDRHHRRVAHDATHLTASAFGRSPAPSGPHALAARHHQATGMPEARNFRIATVAATERERDPPASRCGTARPRRRPLLEVTRDADEELINKKIENGSAERAVCVVRVNQLRRPSAGSAARSGSQRQRQDRHHRPDQQLHGFPQARRLSVTAIAHRAPCGGPEQARQQEQDAGETRLSSVLIWLTCITAAAMISDTTDAQHQRGLQRSRASTKAACC